MERVARNGDEKQKSGKTEIFFERHVAKESADGLALGRVVMREGRSVGNRPRLL